MRPLLIVGGSTGSGKSALAVACAKRMDGEVISADSMQIYKKMDIGTAKITEREKEGVPHYMIDIVEPTESFTAAEYKKQAEILINDIYSRGKLPILCGGTGLYINAVLHDLSFSGEYDPDLREDLLRECREKGKEYMHEKLAALDPDAAMRLHVNDEKRVIRAIEKRLTGGEKESDLEQLKYPYKMFLTYMPREILYDRINQRVDQMMKEGLRKEVRGLLENGIGYDKQCMQAIAYKEWAFCDKGEMNESEVVELIKKNTRNYAKRQITWFKQYNDAISLDMTKHSLSEIVDIVEKAYDGEGK